MKLLAMAIAFFGFSCAFAGGGQGVQNSYLKCQSDSDYGFYITYLNGQAVQISGRNQKISSDYDFNASDSDFQIKNGKVYIESYVDSGFSTIKNVELNININGLNSKSIFGLSEAAVLKGRFSGSVEGVALSGNLSCQAIFPETSN